jgi:hypothetical protein
MAVVAGLSLGGIGGTLLSWVTAPLIMVVVAAIAFLFIFLVLYFRKRRALVFGSAEFVDLGGGRTNINFLGNKSVGWFGKKKGFLGLWRTGNKVMMTKNMREIQLFSEEDFQEVNGERAVVFYRDPVRRCLFPINKLVFNNKDIVADIAPAEYTDAAIDIIQKNEVETLDKLSKFAPYIMFALMGMIFLIAIIVIINYVNGSQTQAKDMLLSAGKSCLESAKSVCSQIALGSSAP